MFSARPSPPSRQPAPCRITVARQPPVCRAKKDFLCLQAPPTCLVLCVRIGASVARGDLLSCSSYMGRTRHPPREGHAALEGSACRPKRAFLRRLLTETVASWRSEPRHTRELASCTMNVLIEFCFVQAIPVQQLSKRHREVEGCSLRALCYSAFCSASATPKAAGPASARRSGCIVPRGFPRRPAGAGAVWVSSAANISIRLPRAPPVIALTFEAKAGLGVYIITHDNCVVTGNAPFSFDWSRR